MPGVWNVDHVLSSLSLCLWDVIRVEVHNLIETWKIARASQHPPTIVPLRDNVGTTMFDLEPSYALDLHRRTP